MRKQNLVEKALTLGANRKQRKNNFSEEEWELCKTFLAGGVTTRQVIFALNRDNNPNVIYPWILAQLRGAVEKGKIKFL